MKNKQLWKILVAFVLLCIPLCIFYLFQPNSSNSLIPAVFWQGVVVTTLLVGATFLGALVFPFEDRKQ